MIDFLAHVFDASGFPPRWHCGSWTSGHGWLHILSDVGVWSAYLTIPCLLGYFVLNKKDMPFRPIFWLFAAFILACGTTHLMEAVIFWWPAYRLAALIKLITAIVSWCTVVALVPVTPMVLAMRTPSELEREIAAREIAEEALQRANHDLERRVQERVAELARMNVALEQRAVELNRSNAELEQFAYVASHDLQEPLRMVASYLELLAERYKGQLDEKANKYMDYAIDGAVRMKSLIEDLLAFSRLTRGKPYEKMETQSAFDEALANLSKTIEEKGAEVTQGALPPLMANRTLMVQLFQNLIGNALKFCEQAPPRVHVGAEPKNGEWLFTVRDNGIGIAPQHQERIFQIFQRLHGREKYSGTGMGLPICKKVVERHGGRIWVESQPGAGSTFLFTLPGMGLA
jgi:two-component system, chemotaxis family, sensor kinase Cph1